MMLLQLGLLVAAVAEPHAAAQGIVRSNGQPIPGASVVIIQGQATINTTTDEAGEYSLEGLTSGPCRVDVEMFGFLEESRDQADCTSPAVMELRLKPPTTPPTAGPSAQTGQRMQQLAAVQSAQSEIQTALSSTAQPPAISDSGQNPNESFLINGSLSRGLQNTPIEGADGLRGGMPGAGPPGMANGMPGGSAPVPGMGSSRMGGGGRMGGGLGGRMGGGGFSGRGGPGRPGGFGGFRPEMMGNRRNAGRDSIRGAAFFGLRNSALDARPYSLTGQTVDKPSYAQSRFGLLAGGVLRIPKVIDSEKTFFFLNWMGTRSRQPFNSVARVPSLPERIGDFSNSAVGQPITIFDPQTRLPFPGNRIPISRLNTAALGLLNYFPLPNQAGAVQNYQLAASVPENTDNIGVRLNHSLTSSDRLSGGVNYQSRRAERVQVFGFRDSADGGGVATNIGWIRNVRPGIVNTVRFTFNRNANDTLPYFAFGSDAARQLGITGTSSDPINFGPPNLTFTNFGALTDASPVARRDQSSAISESVLVVHRQHNITFGGDYRRLQTNSVSDQNARGTFTFSGLASSAFEEQGQPLAGTGFDLADLLLGLPQSSSIRFGSADTYFRASSWSAFVQDDWRVRSNFSLNLGMRYEFQPPYREKYNRLSNLDIAPGFLGVAAVLPGQSGPYTGIFPAALIDSDRNNIGPRIGFAWKPRPAKSLQVRGGYGWYYNGSVYNQIASRLAQQPPFANTGTVSTSIDHPLTLEGGFAATPSQEIKNTYAVDRGYRVGYAQTWSFSIQQDLPLGLVLEAGYLGTKGTRLDIQRLPNRAAPGSPLTAEQRRLIGDAVGFTYGSAVGNSIYHAAQVRVMRRFRRGVSFNAFYTWSKSIDNASTFGGGGAVVAQNDRDLSAERGRSTFDQRHTLSANFVIGSPFGDGASLIPAHGWVGHLVRDWTMSGGVTANSGQPLTAMVLGNRADAGGTGVVGSARADSTGLAVEGGRFFNLAAFTLPPTPRYGNAGRNTIPGPGLFAINFSLGRSFRLDESRRRLELRVESNNVTNFVSFTRAGTTVNASDYGLPTAAAAMRTVTAQLRFRF